MFGYKLEMIVGQDVSVCDDGQDLSFLFFFSLSSFSLTPSLSMQIFVPEPHKSKHSEYVDSFVHGELRKDVQALSCMFPPCLPCLLCNHGMCNRCRDVYAQRRDGSAFPATLAVSRITVSGKELYCAYIVGLFGTHPLLCCRHIAVDARIAFTQTCRKTLKRERFLSNTMTSSTVCSARLARL